MANIPEDFEETKEKRYTGSAEASDAEKDTVGGEKSMVVTNHLFQSDAVCNSMAKTLLDRLKDRKKYFKATAQDCPAPIELDDTVCAQERLADTYWSKWYYGDPNKTYGDSERYYRDNGVILAHVGKVRGINLSVTPRDQDLTFKIEME